MNKMSKKLGIAMSTVQDRINLLVKRKLIAIKKHKGTGKYKNNCCLRTIPTSTGI